MARVPVSGLVEVSSIALFPAFARMADESARLKSAYLRALGIVTLGAAAVTAMLIAVGEPLVVLVLGEKWRGAGIVLVAMAPLGLGKAFTTVGEEAIKGAGRTRLLNWYTLTEVSLSLILLVVLIGPLGLVGVALSISITGLVVGALVTALARPVVGVSVRQVAAVSLPPIAAAVVGFAVAAPLEHQVFHSDSRGLGLGLLLLCVDGIVFLAVYLGLLLVFSPSVLRDVWHVVLGLVRRRRAVRDEQDVVDTLEAGTGTSSSVQNQSS
jgi:PST family polysaccharide transporter